MESRFLQSVVDAMRPALTGSSLGRVWQPSGLTLALDCRLPDGRVVFVSVRPEAPALFLALRSVAELEPAGQGDRAFAALLRKRLRGARIASVRRIPDERIVVVAFGGFAASGDAVRHDLVVELTGRSSNVYLVDGASRILAALRETPDSPRQPGDPYAPPPATSPRPSRLFEREVSARAARTSEPDARRAIEAEREADAPHFYVTGTTAGHPVLSDFRLTSQPGADPSVFADPSEAADEWWRQIEAARTVASRARAVAQRLRVAHDRAARTIGAMDADLAASSDSDRDRELAESLLAQVATARSVAGGFAFVDYYDASQREVTVPADRGESAHQVAERLFARHRRARRTREAIAERRPAVAARLDALQSIAADLDAAHSVADVDAAGERLDALLGVRRTRSRDVRPAAGSGHVSGARRFVSSDGYEILVGRTGAANDELTFRVARPSDIWLHAADYPGSHVVIRVPRREEVPHRTLLEAAQLAAFYSQAKDDALVDVRYTERKFVAKPRGAAAGLVRLQRFRTVAVRPKAGLARGDD